MITRGDFAHRLCSKMLLEPTQTRLIAFVAWMRAEGTAAKFNPLATTLKMKGSADFNTTGVQNYVDLNQGLKATEFTLFEAKFEPIVEALRTAANVGQICHEIAYSDWGTGPLILLVYPSVKADYAPNADEPIGQ